MVKEYTIAMSIGSINTFYQRIILDFSVYQIENRPKADFKEKIGNYLMKSWSVVFDHKKGCLQTTLQKTLSVFTRIIAAVVGLIFLPIMVLGVVLRASSH